MEDKLKSVSSSRVCRFPIYCALKFNLQCCTTETSTRGEMFHDFPRNLVTITENRGHFGENISQRVVVCVVTLHVKF